MKKKKKKFCPSLTLEVTLCVTIWNNAVWFTKVYKPPTFEGLNKFLLQKNPPDSSFTKVLAKRNWLQRAKYVHLLLCGWPMTIKGIKHSFQPHWISPEVIAAHYLEYNFCKLTTENIICTIESIKEGVSISDRPSYHQISKSLWNWAGILAIVLKISEQLEKSPISRLLEFVRCQNDLGDIQVTEAETKWTPFRRRHFQAHFHEWKCLNSY